MTFITGYQYYQKSLDYVKAEEAKKVKEVKGVVIEEPVAAAVKTAKKTAAKKSEAKSSVKKSAGKKKAPAKKAKTAK